MRKIARHTGLAIVGLWLLLTVPRILQGQSVSTGGVFQPLLDYVTSGAWTNLGRWKFTDLEVIPGSPSAAVTSGAVTSSSRIIKSITGIANNTYTDLVTVTVPNSNHGGVVRITLLGSLGSGGSVAPFECSATLEGSVAFARTPGVAAVAGAASATLTGSACVSGAQTITLAYQVSAVTGGVTATNTFTIQGRIAGSGLVPTNHTAIVDARVVNSQASGITLQ